MNVSPTIQHALNGEVISADFVINDAIGSTDDPKPQPLMASCPSGMRTKVGMFSELSEGLFCLQSEMVRRVQVVVGCHVGINSRQVPFCPLTDDYRHRELVAYERPRCQISARTFWVNSR